MRAGLALLMVVTLACGPAKPAPAASPMSVPQLKFAVIDKLGAPVWCDRDFYPVGGPDIERQRALARYPEIKADATTYAAIAAHERLPSGDLDDAQKLALYRAWKQLGALELKAGGAGYSFDYIVQSTGAGYERVGGQVAADGAVTVDRRTPTNPPPCPICLAASTLIATPEGPVRVTDLGRGAVVWSQDLAGRRVAEPVVAVGSMEAPPSHRVVHLVLADGRSLLASPGHRTADGRELGSLRPGDRIDGSAVAAWELIPYEGGATYDLLPAGPTGFYWADGILLASTLR